MGMGGTPGGTTAQGPSTDDDSNLVELTVYGITTLYERFPTKP